MATALWTKGYAHDATIARFEAARNAALDAELARYDILGSLAHARMLRHAGLLSAGDWSTLDAALRELLTEAHAGALVTAAEEEDIHTLVERLVVARAGETGEAGKKLHTGRSRNDPALVDLRLYAKDALLGVVARALTLAETLTEFARAHEWVPMPGYTHMRRAMLSSVGLWSASFAEALLDDLMAFIASSQRFVSGDVWLKLHRGQVMVVGRRSPHSLYQHALATYDRGDQFDHNVALGFIKLWGLPVTTQAQTQLLSGDAGSAALAQLTGPTLPAPEPTEASAS